MASASCVRGLITVHLYASQILEADAYLDWGIFDP